MKKTAIFALLISTCMASSCKSEQNLRKNTDKSDYFLTKDIALTTDEQGLSRSFATLKTVHGNVVIKFYANDAKTSVKRFVELVSMGFYDNLIFHRVVQNFVIQSGDPTGSGQGGSGKKLPLEVKNHLNHVKGTLSLARIANDPNSSDSQFFITLKESPSLDGKYTILGKVVRGLDILDKIQQGDKILTFSFHNKDSL
ncbi:peptidylprolyl isomerase [Halobacteriovorax sp. GB3]|uniref:peptidylprolyl isomerase n=1 Tax=Halobacteriovorax sp. GB3 TaxID=2719615 RepID=UPI00235FDE96|nr:peptidylprolyl isomerase [Halobacteriovorax sp. GB3]MDD0854510.1 peptidylprolyl isomerase [Halobacteriovorax sp. GB3]